MSLVTYGSSDESDSEEENDMASVDIDPKMVVNEHHVNKESKFEVTNSPLNNIQNVFNGTDEAMQEAHISDEEDYFIPDSRKASFNSIVVSTSDIFTLLSTASSSMEPTGMLDLPTPKNSELLAKSAEEDSEEAELEDIVKPKPSEMPSEKMPPRKIDVQRQTVKIVVPAMLEGSDTDDDADNEPAMKRAKIESSKGKCSLFSILPPPKNSSSLSSRQLIPHSVSKKLQQPSTVSKPLQSSLPPQKSAQPVRQPITAKSTVIPIAPVSTISRTYYNKRGEETEHGKQEESDDSDNEPDSGKERSGSFFFSSVSLENQRSRNEISSPVESYLADAPLKFKETASQPKNLASYSFVNMRCGLEPMPEDYFIEGDESNEDFASSGVDEQLAPHHEQLSLQEKQFLQLQGKRRGGGKREEVINIIDVHADDHINPDEMMKNVMQESADSGPDMMSRSKKNKDLPTSQQSRKHQIVWLAHKAKEREVDLKNQWADNRMTKKQTQAKYGF